MFRAPPPGRLFFVTSIDSRTFLTDSVQRLTAGDVMHSDPYVATTGSTVGDCVAQMLAGGVRELAIVGVDGYFVGVLTMAAVLRAALPDAAQIAAELGSVEAAFSQFLRAGRQKSHLPIDPLIDLHPVVANPHDHVGRIATLMLDRNIDRLPVVVGDVVIGAVSRADVCRGVLSGHRP